MFTHMMRVLAALIVAAICESSVQAAATVVFDSYTKGGAFGSTYIASAGSGEADCVYVSQTTVINNIGVLNTLYAAGNIKFVIFDNPSHTPLLVTLPKSFSQDTNKTRTWKMSDDLSATLQAGKTYDIGYISDVGSEGPLDSISESQNGFTSYLETSTVTNFDSPKCQGSFGAVSDSAIRLYAIPEPSTLALLAIGALSLPAYAWRRQK